MKSLNKINAIAEYKTLTKELLLFYLAANDFGEFSVWVCRYNKDKQLIETKRFTAEQEEQMFEYIRSKGVSKEAFCQLYSNKIMLYFHTAERLRRDAGICREILNSNVNTLTFLDGSTVTECSECVIG